MNGGVDGVVKAGVQVRLKAARTSYTLPPLRYFMSWHCSGATVSALIASPVWRVTSKGVAATSHSFIVHEGPMPHTQIPMSEHLPRNQMSPGIDGLTPLITMHSNQCETRV